LEFLAPQANPSEELEMGPFFVYVHFPAGRKLTSRKVHMIQPQITILNPNFFYHVSLKLRQLIVSYSAEYQSFQM